MQTWISFLQRFFKAPKTIGAVTPSSASLAALMAGFVDPGARVLELGAGTGALTDEIVKRLTSTDRLTCVEIDPRLATIFRTRFPKITLLERDVKDVLAEPATYDAIVSGLPFVAMDLPTRTTLFKTIFERLSDNGVFIAFQYSLTTKRELESIFPSVKVRFTLFNLPPAFVYVCRKKAVSV